MLLTVCRYLQVVPLAYLTARAHGLHEAEEIWVTTGLPAEEQPQIPEGTLNLPPLPISKVCGPLLTCDLARCCDTHVQASLPVRYPPHRT